MSSSRVLSCLPLSSDVTGSSSFLPSLMSSSLMSFSKFLSCLPLFTDVTSDVIFPSSILPTSLLWIHLHWCHLRVFFSSHFSSLISSSVMSSSPLPCLPLVLHRLTVPCMMFFYVSPDALNTWPYHICFLGFPVVKISSKGTSDQLDCVLDFFIGSIDSTCDM